MTLELREPFSQLLREKMAELEADDAEQAALLDDPIELLCIAASRAVLASDGPLPQQGSQAAYLASATQDNATEEPRTLDVIF